MPAKSACPDIAKRFRASVNMTPKQIRDWYRGKRSLCASFGSTRRRLPKLTDLKAKAPSKWTEVDCQYAQRVVSFNARMGGTVKKHGCTPKAVISLRNWGHQPRQCKVPSAECRPTRKR